MKSFMSLFVVSWGWPGSNSLPVQGIANYPRAQALADSIGNFDAVGCDFDAVWASLGKQGASGTGYPIANNNGMAASDHGAADFMGAFKVVYDADNMYILLKYTDDNYTGTESVQIMWAPYLGIDAIAAKPNAPAQAAYVRYAQFGAYNATFDSHGFTGAIICDFNAAGVGNINWMGNNDVLANNLFIDNVHIPVDGNTGVVKAIYTIGFQALTGNAYLVGNARPDFNPMIWRALNAKKGISFDIKVTDTDPDVECIGFKNGNDVYDDFYSEI